MRPIPLPAPLLERREAQGKVRRCHGDVHLRNIVLENGKPILFDAIEFDDLLATIDILYDLAFVLMDFWQRGLHAHANLLFNRYLWRAPEFEQELEGIGPRCRCFLALRAAIRARVVAALSDIADADHSAEAKSFFGASAAFLRPEPARLVAVGGLSGTGKSTLGNGACRRHRPGAGRGASTQRHRAQAPSRRRRIRKIAPGRLRARDHRAGYGRLLNLAEIALRAGQSIIVDAVHAREDERVALAALAKKLDVPFTGLWLDAPVETLVARVEARQHDASDANAAVVRQQTALALGAIEWTRLDAGQGFDLLLARAQAALNLPAAE